MPVPSTRQRRELGALTGAQIALVRIARRCAVQYGLSPLTGVLAGLPGLLAGTACCAPLLLLLPGVQVTAGVLTLMGVMVPIAFVVLLAGLLCSLHDAAQRCGSALPPSSASPVSPARPSDWREEARQRVEHMGQNRLQACLGILQRLVNADGG